MQLSPTPRAAPLRAPRRRPSVTRAHVPPVCASALHFRHSADGVDENLLVLLHGFGDTHVAFAALGATLRLPQTAVLALRAPHPMPFGLDGASWFESVDPDTLERWAAPLAPAQRRRRDGSLAAVARPLAAALSALAWPPDRVHLLGYGDGATVAVHAVLEAATAAAAAGGGAAHPPARFGSVAAVCGAGVPDALPAPRAPPVPAHAPGAAPGPAPQDPGGPGASVVGRAHTRALLLLSRADAATPAAAVAATAAELAACGADVTTHYYEGGGPRMPASAADVRPLMAHFGASLARRLVALEDDPSVVQLA